MNAPGKSFNNNNTKMSVCVFVLHDGTSWLWMRTFFLLSKFTFFFAFSEKKWLHSTKIIQLNPLSAAAAAPLLEISFLNCIKEALQWFELLKNQKISFSIRQINKAIFIFSFFSNQTLHEIIYLLTSFFDSFKTKKAFEKIDDKFISVYFELPKRL